MTPDEYLRLLDTGPVNLHESLKSLSQLTCSEADRKSLDSIFSKLISIVKSEEDVVSLIEGALAMQVQVRFLRTLFPLHFLTGISSLALRSNS